VWNAPAAWNESFGGAGGIGSADEVYLGRGFAKNECGGGGDDGVDIVILKDLGRGRDVGVVNGDDGDAQ
jgi:hypothetical protein